MAKMSFNGVRLDFAEEHVLDDVWVALEEMAGETVQTSAGAESGLEYVVETSGAHQMSTWLAAIRASMDRPYTDGDLPSSSR
ncbi:hypothetical protein FJT64_025964 [Amphibalanus amphitrite]|uniref:Uncharacterized protein n=1 Tax=Amphibalanus amphitrite TaxID=1232801 RepID=A0A6A4W602_AMPAM|nr:hypothetical protein FJT64_025964 [Amphibalanus amphitrite]